MVIFFLEFLLKHFYCLRLLQFHVALLGASLYFFLFGSNSISWSGGYGVPLVLLNLQALHVSLLEALFHVTFTVLCSLQVSGFSFISLTIASTGKLPVGSPRAYEVGGTGPAVGDFCPFLLTLPNSSCGPVNIYSKMLYDCALLVQALRLSLQVLP